MKETPRFEIAIGWHRFDPLDEEPTGSEQPQPEAAARGEAAPAFDPRQARAWIVQFQGRLAAEDIARLRNLYGLRLRDYVPNLAYLERLDPEAAWRVRADPLTRACVPYRPEFKISPSIRASAEPAALTAILFDDADPDRVRALLEEAGASDFRVADSRRLGGHASVRFLLADLGQLDHIARIDEVRWIEPLRRIISTNVAGASTNQSGAPDRSPIWDRGLHGEGQVIHVADSAPLDIGHCFFADPTDNTPRPQHRKVLAIRNASGTPVDDGNGHATFVAGCAAGDDAAAPGAAPRRGGAWAAKLVSSNTHDHRLAGHSLFDELDAARTTGAFIHSNSWIAVAPLGGNSSEYDEVAQQVDEFTWIDEDHLVLGGGGLDDGNPTHQLGPPGTAKNAICVSAADAHPNHNKLCLDIPGPTVDGRRKPELVTVGRVESAIVATPCDTGPRGCATSWATPHAAAAAALARQYFTNGWYPTGKPEAGHALTPSAALLKALLLNATVDMAGVPDYPSASEGWGRLQLDRGLFFEGGARKLRVWDTRHAKGLNTGDSRTHHIKVDSSSQPLKVTLVWTEPPGVPGSLDPVVNNLDLRVISPEPALYVGNRFLGGVSEAFDPSGNVLIDDRNNVEMVLVNAPAVGRWTIEIRAFHVVFTTPHPGQGYALVVTGDVAPVSCFVATAVYRDPDHADVAFLRAWRDAHLSAGARGRTAMRILAAAYARVGPRLARLLDDHVRVATLLRRFAFAPAVAVLRRREPRRPAAGATAGPDRKRR